ncbi:membrane-spanning 4-domains subfamily A member 3 [Capricornis sumatraensis]|uniref:membrane-spanning 4-domains subfamily A member 3 n=1 Tax=Capricornis sumatraensis TaxID=34865 RepID=UPI003604CD2A
MASREADGAELRAARAGEARGRPGEAAAGGSSACPRSQNHPEVLQVLGAVQILNGAVILALGGFMYSFLVSGILSVLAGKKPTKTLLESSLGMHSASATVAVVGIVFLAMNLFANDPLLKGCQSSQPPALCTYMEASSNGLISLMLVLTLLELCIACSVVALWLKANCCHLKKVGLFK